MTFYLVRIQYRKTEYPMIFVYFGPTARRDAEARRAKAAADTDCVGATVEERRR